jgi:hypothetical protein
VPDYPVSKSERAEAYSRSAWASNYVRTYAPGNLWSFLRGTSVIALLPAGARAQVARSLAAFIGPCCLELPVESAIYPRHALQVGP